MRTGQLDEFKGFWPHNQSGALCQLRNRVVFKCRGTSVAESIQQSSHQSVTIDFLKEGFDTQYLYNCSTHFKDLSHV